MTRFPSLLAMTGTSRSRLAAASTRSPTRILPGALSLVDIDLRTCPACSVERLIGSPFDDTLVGDDSLMRFDGGDGNDTIEPGAGWDSVFAGAGNDQVNVGTDPAYDSPNRRPRRRGHGCRRPPRSDRQGLRDGHAFGRRLIMESKALDSVEFRGTQRQQWDGAATGWRRWSELIDGAASAISERLVELAGVEPGSRVLDVAAGYGEPSLTAARAAGPEGSVTATDISAEMIAFGRERAAAAGLATSTSSSRMRRPWSSQRTASTPRSRAGGSSSSLTARRPRRASAGSSSPAREWRSAPGDRPIACRSWRFP